MEEKEKRWTRKQKIYGVSSLGDRYKIKAKKIRLKHKDEEKKLR